MSLPGAGILARSSLISRLAAVTALLAAAVADRRPQPFFRAEVIVDGRDVGAGARRNGSNGCTAIAVLGEGVDGRIENASLSGFGLGDYRHLHAIHTIV